DRLAALPVAHEHARLGIADRGAARLQDRLRSLGWRRVAIARTEALHVVLLEDARDDLRIGAFERVLENRFGARMAIGFLCRGRGTGAGEREQSCGKAPHRFTPGTSIKPPFACCARKASRAMLASDAKRTCG